MDKLFPDHVAWITGGGSGIGEAIAYELANQGAAVAVSGRRVEKLEAVVANIEAKGGKAVAVQCDVTDEASIRDAVTTVVEKLGKLDIAIANAGFGVTGAIVDLDMADWERQFRTNVFGAALTARYAFPELQKTKGRYAVVGSVAGFIAAPKTGCYNASKFAVRGFAETLAIELKGTGVTCTALHPGFVESDIAKVDNQGVYKETRKDKRPQKLMWKAEDAAKVCVRALHRRKREFVFTGHGKFAAFISRHFPGVTHHILKVGSPDWSKTPPKDDPKQGDPS